MMATMTVEDLAGLAYDSFERRTRDNGETFFSVKDGAPEWVTEIVREAHGDMLPDDFVCLACLDAFDYIHENGASEDGASEFADSNVSVYTADLVRWLGSHLARVSMCDEAAEELGPEGSGIVERMSLGQYFELRNIFSAVLAGLEAVDADES